MLLGSNANNDSPPAPESLVIQLMLQQRYAESYELLVKQQKPQASAVYNLALCLHWSGNYEAALNQLDKVQFSPHPNRTGPPPTDANYNLIRNKQNEYHDYLQGVTEAYVQSFPVLFSDAIIRLKTDCWLQLRNYPKVISVAKPIAFKGYKNIADALNQAQTANEQRI